MRMLLTRVAASDHWRCWGYIPALMLVRYSYLAWLMVHYTGLASSRLPQAACRLQVAGKQMVGIYLSVWVRRGMLPHVRGVQVMSLGTGLLGYLGNKGEPSNAFSS